MGCLVVTLGVLVTLIVMNPHAPQFNQPEVAQARSPAAPNMDGVLIWALLMGA